MGENGNAAAQHTAINAVQALGRGFDVNFDTRLLYCKGVAGYRIVEIDEEHVRDVYLDDQLVLHNISKDIKNSQEPIGCHSYGVCNFHEMLSVDGFYIPLAKLELTMSQLVLQEKVKQAVPISWDPLSLASFIETLGTHVITSVTIGGKDEIYVKQHHSSPLSTMEIKNYGVDPRLFNSQGIYPQPSNAPYLNGKEIMQPPHAVELSFILVVVLVILPTDVTVIFRRRGGDDLEQNHTQWVKTVRSSPDVIEMTFYPITALLDGVAGKEHLARAMSLYLECNTTNSLWFISCNLFILISGVISILLMLLNRV
ncbi:Kinase superfamily protein isoform 1 [Hibiscus syriacus]|uniref:Kinase superfamily protein isoform 1 n=1 Tax=Hibiscus syriacus TaxID=106335 RepID=A0A6A3C427_HIBSY|nr:Kinase superfamily protein isoform 1 [Hibiscus syriacus]